MSRQPEEDSGGKEKPSSHPAGRANRGLAAGHVPHPLRVPTRSTLKLVREAQGKSDADKACRAEQAETRERSIRPPGQQKARERNPGQHALSLAPGTRGVVERPIVIEPRKAPILELRDPPTDIGWSMGENPRGDATRVLEIAAEPPEDR